MGGKNTSVICGGEGASLQTVPPFQVGAFSCPASASQRVCLGLFPVNRGVCSRCRGPADPAQAVVILVGWFRAGHGPVSLSLSVPGIPGLCHHL